MALELKFPDLPSSGGTCAFKAPMVYVAYNTIPEGTVTTPTNPINLAENTPLPAALGQTIFTMDSASCEDLLLKIKFYDNGDNQACDNCPPPSTSVPTVIEKVLPWPKGFTLNSIPGLVVGMEAVSVPQSEWTGDWEADYALAGTLDANGNTIGITASPITYAVASNRVIKPCCLVPEIDACGTTIPSDADYITNSTVCAGSPPPVFPVKGRVKTVSNEWSPTQDYVVGDLVTYEGVTYRCIQNISATIKTPDALPDNWEVA